MSAFPSPDIRVISTYFPVDRPNQQFEQSDKSIFQIAAENFNPVKGMAQALAFIFTHKLTPQEKVQLKERQVEQLNLREIPAARKLIEDAVQKAEKQYLIDKDLPRTDNFRRNATIYGVIAIALAVAAVVIGILCPPSLLIISAIIVASASSVLFGALALYNHTRDPVEEKWQPYKIFKENPDFTYWIFKKFPIKTIGNIDEFIQRNYSLVRTYNALPINQR